MKYFKQLDQLEAKELMPGFRGKFVHMEHMTISYWDIAKGSLLPVHSHHHEQTTHVIKGELELTIGGETKVMTFGDIATIPGHAEHSGRALTDCLVIDVFSPVREDYR